MQRCKDGSRGLRTCPEVLCCVQRCQGVSRGLRTCPEVSGRTERCQDASRGVRTCSEVSGHVQRGQKLYCMHHDHLDQKKEEPNKFKRNLSVVFSFEQLDILPYLNSISCMSETAVVLQNLKPSSDPKQPCNMRPPDSGGRSVARKLRFRAEYTREGSGY